MPSPNRATAEQQADQLRHELDVHDRPVPVEAIAKSLGATVLRQRMDAHISGMTYRDGTLVVIGLNAGQHPLRQRFTLAHEIGHVRLHPGRPLTVDSNVRVDFRDNISSLASDTEEIEANAFGAALLMPGQAVRRDVQQLQDGGMRGRERLVSALAKIFEVSTEAMGYRLINLGLSGA